jgi:glycosyltransferase involved in cell wall biosynthesis
MISAIILAKNEEKNIERCIESVKWCAEVIVIDDNSTDKTAEIARKNKATVFSHSLGENFSSQRNWAISKANNEWVFFVDSDEIVSDALAYEISNAIQLRNQNLNNYNGFYVRRTDFMWGKQLKYGEATIRLLRLGRKGMGTWKGMAHERWEIKKPVEELINPIFHFPHKNLEEFLKEINYYTDIRANELKKNNIKATFLSILFYPTGKFILNFFIKKGFMDGIRGLIFAIVMSFHSFLVRGKLWLKYNE